MCLSVNLAKRLRIRLTQATDSKHRQREVMQSHGGQVRSQRGGNPSVDGVTDAVTSARFARRRQFKAALFGAANGRDDDLTTRSAYLMNSGATHAVIGTVLDVSPHILVLQTAGG